MSGKWLKKPKKMDSFEVEVKSLKTKPYLFRNRWIVRVEYILFGRFFKQDLEFKTKEESEKVNIGYKFIV